MIKDSTEAIHSISWSVYGKIKEIIKDANIHDPTTDIKYTYDAQGNRISKIVDQPSMPYKRRYTWYVRDAQGNVLCTYGALADTSTALDDLFTGVGEVYLYGSSRIGSYTSGVSTRGPDGPGTVQYFNNFDYSRRLKTYELTNHLGNVITTISDEKIAVPSSDSSLNVYFEPDILTANDYFPFGMLSRIATTPSGSTYRYGFNGKENDLEAKGEQNQLDYGNRIYDPRVGRFLSVDPLQVKYPELSPYQFASNSPVANIDLDGREKIHYTIQFDNHGKSYLKFDRIEHFSEPSAKLDWGDGPLHWDIKTVVDPRVEFVVHETVQRSIDRMGNVLWYNTQKEATFNSYEEADKAVSGQTRGIYGILPYDAQDLAQALTQAAWNVSEEERGGGGYLGRMGANGGFVSSESAPTAATDNAALGAHGGVEEAVTSNTAGTEEIGLQQRAQEIHSQLPQFAQDKTTTAVGEGTTANGGTVKLVASSEARLSPAQRAALKPNEIGIKNRMLSLKSKVKMHAEQKITLFASQNNIKLSAVAPSRPACPSCVISVNNAGAQIEGKIKQSTTTSQ